MHKWKLLGVFKTTIYNVSNGILIGKYCVGKDEPIQFSNRLLMLTLNISDCWSFLKVKVQAHFRRYSNSHLARLYGLVCAQSSGSEDGVITLILDNMLLRFL